MKSDSKKIILIADDDIDLLEQMQLQVKSMGYETVTAESQSQAEQKLEEFKPDLAIFDLMMENQDSGFVLSYKAKKKYPGLPVILVTGVTSETGMHFDTSTDEMRSWIKADAVLDKDVRFEQLQREIKRLINGK